MLSESPSVLVITPSVGSTKLLDAIESVRKQTYYNFNHLVVFDGVPSQNCDPYLRTNEWGYLPTICELPYKTGTNGSYGHRIYAGFSHLVNHDYICFLDEDNWYEPNHIESLVSIIPQHDFAFSYRKIYDKDKNYLIDDNCESLGTKPTWVSDKVRQPEFLIDTSSWIFSTNFLKRTGHLWSNGWGADRIYLKALIDNGLTNGVGSGLHTLCYRLDGNPGSVTKEFFEEGNMYYDKVKNG